MLNSSHLHVSNALFRQHCSQNKTKLHETSCYQINSITILNFTEEDITQVFNPAWIGIWSVSCCGGRKTGEPGEKPWEHGENQLHCKMEFGCPTQWGASAKFVSLLADGDQSNDWPILATQPWVTNWREREMICMLKNQLISKLTDSSFFL